MSTLKGKSAPVKPCIWQGGKAAGFHYFMQTVFCRKKKWATRANSTQPEYHRIQKCLSGENIQPQHS